MIAMFYLKVYLSMLLCFLAVDLLWLGVMARGFYQKQLEFLLRPSPNWPVAILFYLIYVTGILVFVVSPALQSESWRKALLLGAFFWVYHLRNLRPNQSRNSERMAVGRFRG